MQCIVCKDSHTVHCTENLYPVYMTVKLLNMQVMYAYSAGNSDVGCPFLSQHWHAENVMSGSKDLENVKY